MCGYVCVRERGEREDRKRGERERDRDREGTGTYIITYRLVIGGETK